MTTKLPTPSPVSARRFFWLIGGVAIATIGLIFLIVGINLVSSQSWPTVTGTVQSCTVQSFGTGSSHSPHHICDVTWQADGAQHSNTVDFGQQPIANGRTYQIKVHGNTAVLPAPAWAAYLTLVVGLALIGTCIFFVVRSRRRVIQS